jgi:hypothetical protein
VGRLSRAHGYRPKSALPSSSYFADSVVPVAILTPKLHCAFIGDRLGFVQVLRIQVAGTNTM